ncbi:MAG: family 65 glycosyl hydrolase [Bacteroidetes bacterium]|nr:MAG: family 65 glycosyl hydrolase [Bacteroidota bacterium]
MTSHVKESQSLYEIDEWNIIEKGWDPTLNRASESVFSLGNGRFGLRANFEEIYSGDSLPGHYVAGVYYPDKTRVGWWKNGYPETFAKVLNATNWTRIEVVINGTILDLGVAHKVTDFCRNLDMRTGLLTRTVTVELEPGVLVKIVAERFCSMAKPDIALLRYSITPISGVDSIVLIPSVDADVKNEDTNWDERFWSVDKVFNGGEEIGCIVNTTEKTNFTVATSFSSSVEVRGKKILPTGLACTEFKASVVYDLNPLEGEEIILTKYIGLVSSLNFSADDVESMAIAASIDARNLGFENEYDLHCKVWEQIWHDGDIVILGDNKAQQAIRFNVFHLNATYRGDDPLLNIGPKGFTGEKYGGATYWDTEAYCVPFFLSTHDSDVAKQLLVYRFNHLEQAIENAKKLGFSGGAALYPMVTMNGEESHNEWEITFEEIHRNGAIAYAIFNYVRHTGDVEYLADKGFDVLLGIARFWSQRVNFSEEKKMWVMLGVTGPNEYENNVNNNWYTNYIAKWCMEYVVEVGDLLDEKYPEAMAAKRQAWALNSELEFADFKEKASNIFLPELKGTEIFLQQEGFMDKDQTLASEIPVTELPINQFWSWDRILRSVFIKQADVLQGLYFFANDFTESQLLANFDFYEPRTVHESSLSPCVHSILAAKLGRSEKAYEMYLRTARLDLDDYNNEIHEGLHITSMAGTWMSIVEGFGGFRVENGIPHFTTTIPVQWEEYSFRVRFRGRVLKVTVNKKETTVVLESGDPLQVSLNGSMIQL